MHFLALEMHEGDPEPAPFGTLFKPGGPRYRRGYFPLPKGNADSLDVDALVKTILSRPPYNLRPVPSMTTSYARVFESQTSMTPEATDQVSPMGEDPPTDPSHSSSGRIAVEGRTTAGIETETVDQCPDRPTEAQEAQDVNMNTDPPQSDPTPMSSTNETKHKSAFVKVMELDEDCMLMAYLEAFFGELADVQRRLPPRRRSPSSTDRSLPFLPKDRWPSPRRHQPQHNNLP